MKSYELYLDKSASTKRFVITLPKQVTTLAQPITLSREKYEEPEPETPKFKKKSEQVEIEDQAYVKIKESERSPLLITDADQHTFAGRLQDTRAIDTNSGFAENETYFVFINNGNSFRVVPVSHWYRFTQRIGYDTLTLEEAEARLSSRKDSDKWIMHKRKDDRENGDMDIDFEELFDDDDGEDYNMFGEEEKELDIAGEKTKNLLSNYDHKNSDEEEVEKDNDKESTKESIKEEKPDERDVKRRKIESLNIEGLREAFVKEPIRIRELLVELKKRFTIDDAGKQLIKEFIRTDCNFELDPETKEKLLFLKVKFRK